MQSEMQEKSGSRLFYLDNLRIFLTILVILHHTAIAYGASGDWVITDPAVDELSPIILTFFTAVNQSYFMSAFFLLGGYFTPRSLERKGNSAFLKDRLIRLGIPILVYSVLIYNLNQAILGVWLRGLPFRWTLGYQTGHLWFLQALLIFAVIYVVYRAWAGRDPQQRRGMVQDRFPSDWALILSIVLLTGLTFVVRLEFPVGEWVSPGFQLAHFVHYTFAFFMGILAYRGGWFHSLERKQARRWGLVAVAMLPLFFIIAILGGALESDAALAKFLGGLHWQALAYTTWESIMFIAVLTFLLYTFRERFNQTGPRARFMAASVYTVYIVHQTVVIALNVLLLPVSIPTIVKFLVVSLIAVPVCFVLAGLIRKLPYADRVLG